MPCDMLFFSLTKTCMANNVDARKRSPSAHVGAKNAIRKNRNGTSNVLGNEFLLSNQRRASKCAHGAVAHIAEST